MAVFFRTRRTARTAAAVSAAALVAAGAAVSAFVLQPAQAAPAPRAAHELTLTAVKQVDTEPARIAVGDSWVTYLKVYDDHGAKVGDGSARCSAVLVTRNGAITQCQRVLRTADGDLALSAMIDRFGSGPFKGKSAVVGGTGRYAGASGEAQVVMDGRKVSFRIRLAH
jgi:hypothetical protein